MLRLDSNELGEIASDLNLYWVMHIKDGLKLDVDKFTNCL